MAELSLTASKDIKESESYLKDNLKKIENATGILFEVEVDWLAIDAAATEDRIKNALGQMIYDWYLGGLADNLEKLCKNDVLKESLEEACPEKMISFIIGEPDMEGYGSCTFDDGILYVTLPPSNLAANASDLGKDIELEL